MVWTTLFRFFLCVVKENLNIIASCVICQLHRSSKITQFLLLSIVLWLSHTAHRHHNESVQRSLMHWANSPHRPDNVEGDAGRNNITLLETAACIARFLQFFSPRTGRIMCHDLGAFASYCHRKIYENGAELIFCVASTNAPPLCVAHNLNMIYVPVNHCNTTEHHSFLVCCDTVFRYCSWPHYSLAFTSIKYGAGDGMNPLWGCWFFSWHIFVSLLQPRLHEIDISLLLIDIRLLAHFNFIMCE